MIGGNTTAIIQTSTITENSIGEQIREWADVHSLVGFLDQMSGDSRYTTYNAKIQESTHVFMSDYVELGVKAEECRMVVNGEIYDVTLIDDPMGLHQHLEIYLKYTGGQ